jgi:hypothetical protein
MNKAFEMAVRTSNFVKDWRIKTYDKKFNRPSPWSSPRAAGAQGEENRASVSLSTRIFWRCGRNISDALRMNKAFEMTVLASNEMGGEKVRVR